MTDSNHILAIHIEGIGPEQPSGTTADRLGYIWTSNFPVDGDTEGTYAFTTPDQSQSGPATIRRNELIVDGLSGIGDSINPFASEIGFSGFDFSVRGNDFNVELLTNATRRPAFEITSTTSSASTSIDTSATGGEIADSVIWVRDETIQVGSHSGGGTYSVERGYYLSEPQPHSAGTKIYTSVNGWQKRKVRFFTIDVANPSPLDAERRYVGSIDGSPEHRFSTVTVSTGNYASELKNARVNRNPFTFQDLAGNGSSIEITAINEENEDEETIFYPRGSIQYDRNGKSKLVKEGKYTDGSDITTWIQLNSRIILPYDGTPFQLLQQEAIFDSSSQGPRDVLPFGQTLKEHCPEEISRITEPFAVAREFDEQSDTTWSSTRYITDYGPHDSKYLYHPVSIATCLLMSTYSESVNAQDFDVLHGNWGAGASSLLGSGFATKMRTLIENNPADQVDYFILRASDSVDIWEELTDLLETHGYFWVIETDGSLSIEKLGNSDVDFWSEAQDNSISVVESDTLRRTNGSNEAVDTIEGQVGKIEGIQEPVTIQVQIQEQDPRRAVQLSRRPARTVKMDSISVGNIERAQSILRNVGFLQNFANPRFTFTTLDFLDQSNLVNLDLGKPVVIDSLPVVRKWLARNGSRVDVDPSDLDLAARIVGRTFLPQKRAYEVTLEIIGLSLARYRSPSGKVELVNASQNKITLENDSDAGEIMRGAEPFTVGDEIQIFDIEGAQIDSTIQEITAITGDTITLDGFGFTSNPSAGDIVEIAYLDIDNSGTGYRNTSVLSNIYRPYVGLADDSETLGDSGDTADVYGAK